MHKYYVPFSYEWTVWLLLFYNANHASYWFCHPLKHKKGTCVLEKPRPCLLEKGVFSGNDLITAPEKTRHSPTAQTSTSLTRRETNPNPDPLLIKKILDHDDDPHVLNMYTLYHFRPVLKIRSKSMSLTDTPPTAKIRWIEIKNCLQGAVSIRKTVLPGMVIPMLKIRRPNGRLIFNMEIAIRR